MNRLLAMFAVSLLLLSGLAGCSSKSTSSAQDGETLYKEKCSACHGEQLQGAVGPQLTGMKNKYSEEELLKMINEGTPKMPGNLLSEEGSKTVAKWLIAK